MIIFETVTRSKTVQIMARCEKIIDRTKPIEIMVRFQTMVRFDIILIARTKSIEKTVDVAIMGS